MTSRLVHDASAESLARLMAVPHDPDRAARVRTACRAQLARSRQRAARRAAAARFAGRVAAPMVIGTVCALYAVLLVATTLHLQALFR